MDMIPPNQNLRCLVVDDEPQARKILRRHIAAVDSLVWAGECAHAVAAFEHLQTDPVDLLFLDIQMPRMSGLDLLRALKHPPVTILTTAYREFALEGFELDAADYLLKPISLDRFKAAVQKAFRWMNLQASVAPEGLFEQEPFLYFRSERKSVKVLLSDILYIESLKDYVRITTAKGDILSKQAISTLETALPPHRFCRVHRSFIIGLQHVEAWNNQYAQIQGKQIPVGRLFRDNWLHAMRIS